MRGLYKPSACKVGGFLFKEGVMKYLHLCVLLVVVLVLTACSYEDIANKFIPQEESSFAKEYLQKIIDKDFSYVRSHLSAELLDQVSDEKLNEIANYFPGGELLSTEIIGSQTHTFNNTWQGNFSYEYHFEEGWALANVVLKRENDSMNVIGFNVYQAEASQKELNAFTLSNKSLLHYATLMGTVAIPIFIIVTLIFCIRTPINKKKWLWILFVIVGFGSFSLNWTTGQYGIRPLSVNLLGAAAGATSPYSPWILTVTVPLGAIVFWIKRRKLTEASIESMPILHSENVAVDDQLNDA